MMPVLTGWLFVALVHLYTGHPSSFFDCEMTWTHGWKGLGALVIVTPHHPG